MKVVIHKLCIYSVSVCSNMWSAAEFIACKILTSSANNKHLECLITLQGTLINMLKTKFLKHPCGTPKKSSKGSEKVT
jgi:hypothetical protein